MHVFGIASLYGVCRLSTVRQWRHLIFGTSRDFVQRRMCCEPHFCLMFKHNFPAQTVSSSSSINKICNQIIAGNFSIHWEEEKWEDQKVYLMKWICNFGPSPQELSQIYSLFIRMLLELFQSAEQLRFHWFIGIDWSGSARSDTAIPIEMVALLFPIADRRSIKHPQNYFGFVREKKNTHRCQGLSYFNMNSNTRIKTSASQLSENENVFQMNF